MSLHKSNKIVGSLLCAKEVSTFYCAQEKRLLSSQESQLMGAQEMSLHKSNKIVGSLLCAKEVSTFYCAQEKRLLSSQR
jgi:hypothetical protein